VSFYKSVIDFIKYGKESSYKYEQLLDRLEISPWKNQLLRPWSKADEFQSNVPKTKRSFNSLANVENEKGDKL